MRILPRWLLLPTGATNTRPLFFLVVIMLSLSFMFSATYTWNLLPYSGSRWTASILFTNKESPFNVDDEKSCQELWNTTVTRSNATQNNNNAASVCFVHLGKTAGSTLTCMMNRSVQQSGKGNSGCEDETTETDDGGRPPNHNNITTTATTTAISRHVTQRVHLAPAPLEDEQMDAFLITLRNPIERIISWYYYLHPDYPPEKFPRHKQGCANFAFFHYWPTLQLFASVGLAANRSAPNSIGNSIGNSNSSDDECTAWAWGIATGSRHCWHNYWNYNRTYGPLLLPVLENSPRKKEIFAIRTEHTWDDWIKIDRMWGGTGTLEKLPEAKNFLGGGDKLKNLTLDEGGRDNLCRALCEEIQIYKQLLQAAKNFCHADKQRSLTELLETCPKETTFIRECNNT